MPCISHCFAGLTLTFNLEFFPAVAPGLLISSRLSSFNLRHEAINACLAPLLSLDGRSIVTVEGLGDVKNMHVVQARAIPSHFNLLG